MANLLWFWWLGDKALFGMRCCAIVQHHGGPQMRWGNRAGAAQPPAFIISSPLPSPGKMLPMNPLGPSRSRLQWRNWASPLMTSDDWRRAFWNDHGWMFKVQMIMTHKHSNVLQLTITLDSVAVAAGPFYLFVYTMYQFTWSSFHCMERPCQFWKRHNSDVFFFNVVTVRNVCSLLYYVHKIQASFFLSHSINIFIYKYLLICFSTFLQYTVTVSMHISPMWDWLRHFI